MSIVRRVHTANYTTIGNALFEDERLAADEVGIMAYLLSKPNDWEVRRPALARRWDIGRDKIARILVNLIQFGWIFAKRDRLSNGTFCVIYEVRDHPGSGMTLEEAKAATSLGLSDPDDADEGVPEISSPDTGQPGTGQPGTENTSAYIEDSLNPDLLNPESPTAIVRDFSDIRAAWPADHILSVVACETLHAHATDAIKEAAFQGIRPYLDDCRQQNRKICDLGTYYRERRWERFAAKPASIGHFHLQPRTPEAYRWREYYSRTDPKKLRIFDMMMDRNGYTAPSRWPPSIPKEESASPPSTAGPSLMTEEDERELAKGL